MLLCSVLESLLLKVRQVKQKLKCLLVNFRTTLGTLVLKHAKPPVRTDQANADAVTDYHGNHAPRIFWRLVGSESLWPDQIAYSVANVQNCENDRLLGTSRCVGLSEADPDNVGAKVCV